MHNISKIVLLLLLSCVPTPKVYGEIEIKLEDGKVIKEKLRLADCGKSWINANRQYYVKIINQVSKGNKKNINRVSKNSCVSLPINCVLWERFENIHLNIMRYLLEQGADLNITETSIEDNEKPKKKYSRRIYNPKTNKVKNSLPLENISKSTFIGFGSKDEEEKKTQKLMSLFLYFGSKIKLKDKIRGHSVINNWEKEYENDDIGYKKFLKNVSEYIIKEIERYKKCKKERKLIDPDFISLLEEKNIDENIINQIRDYMKK